MYLYILGMYWDISSMYFGVYQYILVHMYLYSRACLYKRSSLGVNCFCSSWSHHLSVRHSLNFLGSLHRQASKKLVQVLEASVFLCLHSIHKLANCLFHDLSILSLMIKPFALRAGIPVITLITTRVCWWLLYIWLQLQSPACFHHAVLHEILLCRAQHSDFLPNNMYKYIRGVVDIINISYFIHVHTKYILTHTWYILCCAEYVKWVCKML